MTTSVKQTTPVINNRWIGDFPKIGIRPVIDARRRGIREALEDQTMGMARRASHAT
jgi:L-fucose isomerase